MQESTASTGKRVVQIVGTPYSYRIDEQPTEERYSYTLQVKVEDGVVEHDGKMTLPGKIVFAFPEQQDILVTQFLRPLAEQLAKAGLKAGDESVTVRLPTPSGGSQEAKLPIRFIPAEPAA
ncbi:MULTISPECIES: hypothetical protein [unclassified Pseudomonas]|uniref:hypothetical protein n=1 Tax=unclassified Pseudomonas TaxID=196821 RepID=UPI002448C877|nr:MULTISPECIES: hypothetical protein [unclassified Pseudomonas]MDG9927429.1 hypothetical protein [Pseudomonas sp. GD04042]MDH0482498.1 hypothetical protein [Pseudomonas sp. GD04015]MDH0602850.1 hypothetical protein [Pseudomonas sp. GD03869]